MNYLISIALIISTFYFVGCINNTIETKDLESVFIINNEDAPPQLPENIKKIDALVKNIYRNQCEIRKLKIFEFKENLFLDCNSKLALKTVSLEFVLDEMSGKLIKYTANDKNVKIKCVELKLKHSDFGQMSYGFNNAFRVKPQTKFVIKINL